MERILNKLENIKFQCDQVIRMLTDLKPEPCEGFEKFWALYPKKDDILEAEQAWAAVVQAHDVPAIVKALEHAKWPTDKKFIPYAHRWLRNKRWLTQQRTEGHGKYKGLSETP